MGVQSLLISSSTFPVARGDGTPQFVWDLAASLRGHLEVTVLVPGTSSAPSFEEWDGVGIRRFSYFWPNRYQRLAYGLGMRENMRRSLLARLQVLPFLVSQARAIRRITQEQGISVVNSHWMVPQGLTVAWARGRSRSFSHVLHVHAADVYLLEGLPNGPRVARYIMDRTDAVFAAGSHVRNALDGLIGRSSGAVIRPVGVNTKQFHVPHQLPARIDLGFPEGYLVFVGRFVEKKGVVYLLRALKRIRELYSGLGLVVIGYGPLEAELRSETRRLNLNEAVKFVGRKSHEEIVEYLHCCRAAVVPSIIDSHGETEGMPTVVLEAMAAGCRVVASAVDGIPDVVHDGENGWLCREKDPSDLASTLIEALESPKGRSVEEAALETARQNDWAEVANQYLQCIQSIRAAP